MQNAEFSAKSQVINGTYTEKELHEATPLVIVFVLVLALVDVFVDVCFSFTLYLFESIVDVDSETEDAASIDKTLYVDIPIVVRRYTKTFLGIY